jgi:hypothetical protein
MTELVHLALQQLICLYTIQRLVVPAPITGVPLRVLPSGKPSSRLLQITIAAIQNFAVHALVITPRICQRLLSCCKGSFRLLLCRNAGVHFCNAPTMSASMRVPSPPHTSKCGVSLKKPWPPTCKVTHSSHAS